MLASTSSFILLAGAVVKQENYADFSSEKEKRRKFASTYPKINTQHRNNLDIGMQFLKELSEEPRIKQALYNKALVSHKLGEEILNIILNLGLVQKTMLDGNSVCVYSITESGQKALRVYQSIVLLLESGATPSILSN